MKTTVLTTGICIALSTITTSALAQSFDCRDARNAAERTICRSPALRNLDRQLGADYVDARRARHSRRAKRHLVRDQRAWLKARNQCESDRGCLINSYWDRLGELNAAAAPTRTVRQRGGFIRTVWNDSPRQRRARQHSRPQCDIQGYSIDKDPRGLNVRSGPGKGYHVIARLKRVRDGASHYILPEMEIVQSKGKWLRISHARVGIDGRTLFRGSGWVHANMVATSTHGNFQGRVRVRKTRSTSSRTIAKVRADTEVGIRGCKGKWAKVSYRGRSGWLAPGNHCGTAQTSCN